MSDEPPSEVSDIADAAELRDGYQPDARDIADRSELRDGYQLEDDRLIRTIRSTSGRWTRHVFPLPVGVERPFEEEWREGRWVRLGWLPTGPPSGSGVAEPARDD